MSIRVKSLLKSFIGKTVLKIGLHQDYLQIAFCKNEILNVYNNYLFNGKSILEIKNSRITNVSQSSTEVKLYFGAACFLRIDMTDQAFNGPEAILFCTSSDEVIVWN